MSRSNGTNNNGVFVSDLHLFSRRSVAQRHADAIHAAAKSAKNFVLGGDIFDFRWSTMRSTRHTVDAAIRWLHELTSPHPDCRFHFVLGNHDTHAGFIQALDDFSRSIANLDWHHYYVRLGHDLFLHGDAADQKMDQATLTLRRARYLHDEQRGVLPNILYDVAVRAQLHRVAASLVHRKRRVAHRLQDYLLDIGHGPSNGLRRVFFGHTHVPMTDYEFGGLVFNNGGAPIRGLDFRIVEF